MAHIFERIVHASLMVVGAQFWFSSGDLKKMLDELQIVKPTIFGAVPRVMNRSGMIKLDWSVNQLRIRIVCGSLKKTI